MNNDNENILSKLNKVPVQVPDDDFFESLKVHVVDKINKEPKIIPFHQRWSFRAAASILLLIGIGTMYQWNSKTEPETLSKVEKADFSTLTKSDILAYIEDNSEDFYEDEITSVLSSVPEITAESVNIPSENLKKTNSIKISKIKLDDLKDEEILRYLEDQDLDEELFFES